MNTRRSLVASVALTLLLGLGGCAAETSDDEVPPQADEQNVTANPYPTTWFPRSEADWDIVPLVKTFQAAAPSWARARIDGASSDALRRGVSVTFQQNAVVAPGGEPVSTAVEMTRQVVDVPYAQFTARIPAVMWGPKLAHYLGGQRRIYARDAQGRATRQLERMVLSPFPCDIDNPLTNNDMTKVEVFQYGPKSATVIWRVRYSDNNATEVDMGSVDFREADAGHTVISFHSAHRLNALGSVHIPSVYVGRMLETMFLDFAHQYADLAKR